MVLVELNWLADAELLGRIGRQALVPVLEWLAPLLAQVGVALPDPGLDDALYFPKLAAVLRAHRVKAAVCLAPFRAASSAAQTQPPVFARGAPLPASDSADYALRRDGPLWHLVFQGRSAILKHEQGLCYAAELLGHPGEPIQKLSSSAA